MIAENDADGWGILFYSPCTTVTAFRATANSRERHLQRRARILGVRSKVHMLTRDIHRCRLAIQTERQKLDLLVAEKQSIEQAR